jgi:hypothetical protein
LEKRVEVGDLLEESFEPCHVDVRERLKMKARGNCGQEAEKAQREATMQDI